MDRFEDAAKSYSTALRFEPQYVEALNNRGIALGKMGRLQEARRNYQSALRLNPGYHEALLNLAVAYDVSNEKPKAVENYRKFLQVAPAQMKEKAAIVSRRVDELVAMAENPAADASFHPAELSAHT
jgi:Flp pilus assembly protein TadD